MTTSSQLEDYLITSNDTITLNTGAVSGNITIGSTTGTSYYYTGAGIGGISTNTITISNGGTSSSGSGFTIGGAGTGYDWSQSFPVDFVNAFPDWDKVQKMCEEYPGLKIAFEKFQTTYKLVVDHYDTPEDKRPKP
jgi:hypothetical protein